MNTPNAETIAAALESEAWRFSSETDLQEAIADIFRARGWAFVREQALGRGEDRPDFLVGDVGVEVKVAGGVSEVLRQLARYTRHEAITALVLATTRAQHQSLPASVGGRPLRVAYLVGGML